MMNDGSQFLDGASLQRTLAGQSLRGAAARVEVVENIRSTNAKLILEAERSDNHFLIAHQQTAGVGRRGGVWQSPPSGNLYLSYCFHTQQPLSEVGFPYFRKVFNIGSSIHRSSHGVVVVFYYKYNRDFPRARRPLT